MTTRIAQKELTTAPSNPNYSLFCFFLSQTSLPWTNLFCFFSKSNFSTATNSYACIGSCSGRGDWWQRVTWSGLPHHSAPCMHLQLVGAEVDQTMHLGATHVGLQSTRRAQARAAVRAGSVLDRTRRKSSAHHSRNTRVRYSFTEKKSAQLASAHGRGGGRGPLPTPRQAVRRPSGSAVGRAARTCRWVSRTWWLAAWMRHRHHSTGGVLVLVVWCRWATLRCRSC